MTVSRLAAQLRVDYIIEGACCTEAGEHVLRLRVIDAAHDTVIGSFQSELIQEKEHDGIALLAGAIARIVHDRSVSVGETCIEVRTGGIYRWIPGVPGDYADTV